MGLKKRKFADDGWALWIDGDDSCSFYLNEWINPRGNSYVDVSTRIYGAKSSKAVNFFVPFHIELKEITDLSYMLSDSEALRALFNTNGQINSEKNKYTSELRYDNRVVSLINLTYEFTSVKKVSYGTVITIDFDYIKDYITADESYIIFRIPHKSIDKIFMPVIDVGSVFEKLNSLIQSPIISKKYGYSIRLNEARLLPPEINMIDVLQQQRIKKALVTISIDEDFEINDSTCYRIRRLEADLHKDYAPEGYGCVNAITYQWVESRSEDMKAHYNFYFTLEHRQISNLSMLIYLVIVLLISVFGSALYDLIKTIF